MSFPQTTPIRPVPGAFLNTPAVASRFQSGPDPVRRNLFPGSENAQLGVIAGTGSGTTTETRMTQPAASTAVSNTTNTGLTTTNVATVARETLPPVAKAAKVINNFLQMDEGFPDLDSYCRRKVPRKTRLTDKC